MPPITLRFPTLFGAAATLAIFGLLGGRPRLWEIGGPTALFGATSALVIIGLVGVLVSVRWTRQKGVFGDTAPARHVAVNASTRLTSGGAITFALLFISDWLTRGYSLFKGPFVRPEAIVVSGALLYLAHRGQRIHRYAVIVMPIVASAICIGSFLAYGDGRTLVSDDHAVFLYRIQLLKEQFPSIPFYYPLWNGGIDARDFFASGALNLFLLFYPIIALVDVWSSYTAIVAVTIFGITPLAMAVAARLLRWSLPACAIAATLSLGSSLFWYRWSLSYGTMGFVVATALAPLCWALWYRIAQPDERISAPLWILAYFVTTLVSFWSLAPLAIAPVVLAFVPGRLRGLCRVRLVTLIVALAITNLPWMALFVTVSRVTSFLGAEQSSTHEGVAKEVSKNSPLIKTVTPTQSTTPTPSSFRHRSGTVSAHQAITHLRTWAISANPLIFIFAPLGLFLLHRPLRLLMMIQGGWLLGIGTLLVSLKPQLELDRMLVVLAHLGSLPAALSLRALMRVRSCPKTVTGQPALVSAIALKKMSALLALSFVVLTPLYGSYIAQNRSIEPIHFSSLANDAIVQTIREHAHDGRALFSGQVLHELDQGHIAPLTILSGHPIVASSPFHNIWSYKQVVPLSFVAQGDEGIERYFDLMNISLVFAHDPKWRRWFEERPETYSSVLKGPPFGAFSRRRERESYFIEGSGSVVAQRTNSVTFVPTSAEGVISFSWFPFLKSDQCRLSPEKISEELTFIRYTECTPGRPVTVSAVSPLNRLKYHLGWQLEGTNNR